MATRPVKARNTARTGLTASPGYRRDPAESARLRPAPRRYRDRVNPADRVATAILGRLPGDIPLCALRRGDDTVVAAEPSEIVVADGRAGLAALDRLGPGF